MSVTDLYTTTTAAVIAHLEGAGLLVGDGRKPVAGGWSGAPGQSDHVSYCIVRHVGGSDIYSDDVTDAADAYRPLYDAWVVGGSRSEAQEALGVVCDRMLRVPLTIDGFRVQRVELDVTFSNYGEATEVTSFEEGARFRISAT